MPAQRVIPTGASEQGTAQVSIWPKPAQPTGIPQVYYDTTRERKDASGRLVKA
jgi:hypothetical protein